MKDFIFFLNTVKIYLLKFVENSKKEFKKKITLFIFAKSKSKT
jgi:hypothetical protein